MVKKTGSGVKKQGQGSKKQGQGSKKQGQGSKNRFSNNLFISIYYILFNCKINLFSYTTQFIDLNLIHIYKYNYFFI